MYTVFLTGGIGSGKSTAAKLMADHGAQVVNLDLIGHEVLEEPQVKLELARRFGEDVLDWPQDFEACWIGAGAGLVDEAFDLNTPEGLRAAFSPARASTLVEAEGALEAACAGSLDYATVNRPRLAERAFASQAETDALNAITHPRILARLGEIVAGPCCMSAGAKVCVVEVALIELVREALVLADEVVAVSAPLGLRRERAVGRGMRAGDFDARNACQATDEERAAIARTVLQNDGDLDCLAAQIDAWWSARAAQGWKMPHNATDTLRTALEQEVPAMTDTPSTPAVPLMEGLASPAVSFVGRHNSGKTTLVTQVIAALVARGLDVGSVKHHGHKGFDVDVPGKDSWRHHEAGANEVAICSPDKFALIRHLEGEQTGVAEIVNLMRPHDIVIVEGYRNDGLPAIEIMRMANERDAVAAAEFVRAAKAGTPFEYDDEALGRDAGRMPDRRTYGIASDSPEVLEAARIHGMQAFDLNEPEVIADYIFKTYCEGR